MPREKEFFIYADMEVSDKTVQTVKIKISLYDYNLIRALLFTLGDQMSSWGLYMPKSDNLYVQAIHFYVLRTIFDW